MLLIYVKSNKLFKILSKSSCRFLSLEQQAASLVSISFPTLPKACRTAITCCTISIQSRFSSYIFCRPRTCPSILFSLLFISLISIKNILRGGICQPSKQLPIIQLIIYKLLFHQTYSGSVGVHFIWNCFDLAESQAPLSK